MSDARCLHGRFAATPGVCLPSCPHFGQSPTGPRNATPPAPSAGSPGQPSATDVADRVAVAQAVAHQPARPERITWMDTMVNRGADIVNTDGTRYQIIHVHAGGEIHFVPRVGDKWGDWTRIEKPERFGQFPFRMGGEQQQFRDWVTAFANNTPRSNGTPPSSLGPDPYDGNLPPYGGAHL